ncbi:MAG: adenylate kinase [Candidatus Anoxychlamydiales bacterium]|nr:adenylate kinase [Candidatus Anoxychlamydiales bacterium]
MVKTFKFKKMKCIGFLSKNVLIFVFFVLFNVKGFSENDHFFEESLKNESQIEKKKIIILLIGPPGSGKGTQSEMISHKYKIPIISMGDIFRKEMRNETNLGKMLDFHKNSSSDFFPDQIAYGFIVKKLVDDNYQHGFILDGYPRTVEQSLVLLKLFEKTRDKFITIVFQLSDDILYKRIDKRLICKNCIKQVREHENINEEEQICKICGSLLEKRENDLSENAVSVRTMIYNDLKDGIIKSLEKYSEVNVLKLQNEDVYEVFEKIEKIINLYLKDDNY